MDKNKKDKYNVNFDDSLNISKNVASNTDCTGIVQTPPITDEESKSYTDIHNIPKPKDRKREK